MGFELKGNAVNQVLKGTTLFFENEPAAYIGVVIRGRICAIGDAVKLSFGPGSFVGVCDLYLGHYVSDYIVDEDAMVYAFPVEDKESLVEILEGNNKEYRGLMVNSLIKNFYELSRINKQYHTMTGEIYGLLSGSYEKYKMFCRDMGEGTVSLAALEQLKEYQDEEPMDCSRFPYFEELAKVPADIQKAFFACGIKLCVAHVEEISGLIAALMIDSRETSEYLRETVSALYNDGSQNLLSALISLASEAGKKGRQTGMVHSLVDTLLDEFNRMEKMLARCMGVPMSFNRARLEKMYSAMLTNGEIEDEGAEGEASVEDIYRGLKGSLQQIIAFSGLPKEKTESFEEYMRQFLMSKDRFSTEDEGRILRKRIADGFYPIYRAVFLNALKETAQVPKAVELFLNFGFMDERLLTKEQTVELCRLDVSTANKYHCNVYTLPEWLYAVYTGKKEPSRSINEEEYLEMLRNKRKVGEITEEEEKKFAKDPIRRLDHEIQNVFCNNHRAINGQLSIFVPVLCSEQMTNGPMRALVTKDRMGQTVEKYREIDFSVFYREVGFADPEVKIEKEFIMKESVPDIILFPVCGRRTIMWQEMSCKRRDSGGRFLFPILCEGNLDDMTIETFGMFRWELCRTMQGAAWNNIQIKSLTSEYSDYLQFYKKNRDLSEERKEKVKQQIAKGRTTRGTFVLDYVLWIKAESMGGMRMNKIAREILAVYCPFNKEIRKALESQPTFADAMARYNRERAKKVKELELKYRTIMTKQKIELPQQMLENLSFYRDK